MKRALSIILSIVFICLILLVIAPSFIDFSKYKAKGEQEFKQITGLDISLNGNIELNILPAPRFIVSDVSVLSPDGSKFDKIASFEALEVNLDLMPLFSGNISVNSVTLLRPVIMLEMHENGKLNILTKELEAGGREDNTTSPSFMPNISLDKIRIKDGSFSYFDHKSKNEIVVQNINADLSAKSLSGPFKGQGSLFYAGNSVNFDIKTDKYDDLNQIISPDVKLTMHPNNISLKYAGVVNLSNGFSLQGQTEIYSENIGRSLSNHGISGISGLDSPLKIKGLLTANQSNLDYKDMDISLGGQKIKGSLRTDFAPLKFNITAKTKEDLVINKFYDGKTPFQKAAVDMNISGNDKAISVKNSNIVLDGHKFLISGDYRTSNRNKKPEINADINISDVFSLAKKFNFNSSSWNKKYKTANIKIKASNIGSDMDVIANINALGGQAIAKGAVNKALSLDNLALQIKHQNMAKALYMFTGTELKLKNLSKPVNIYMDLTQTGKKYSLKNIKGDLSGINTNGNLELNLSGKKPSIKGNLSFGKLNIDSIMFSDGGGQGNANKKSVSKTTSDRWSKEIIDSSALHVANIDLSLSAKSIKYGSWPLINPSMKFIISDGVLNISDLKSDLFGGNIDFSANIKSIEKARQPINFDSKFAITGADLGKLSSALMGKQIVKISGKGNLDMSVNSSGTSSAALISDLSGKGVVNGSNIILDGVDVTKFARALSTESKAGDSLSSLWGGASKGGSTHFNTLDGVFTIKNGVVHLQKMDLDGAGSTIKTIGNINLPNWTLATKHKIAVKGIDGAPSDVPEFEVSFNGSLDNPSQTFGQGLLQDYLNRKIKRKLNKLISDKLGDKLGLPSNDNNSNKTDSQKTDDPVNKTIEVEDIAEEAIKGILGELLR